MNSVDWQMIELGLAVVIALVVLVPVVRRIPKNNQGEIILFFGMRLRQFRVE